MAEAFLRGTVVAHPSARVLRGSAANDRVLSRLRLTEALDLVDLRGAGGLGAVGQTDWLTSCDQGDYHLTQEWATAIRRWAPWAAGMIWQSKRGDVHFALILFEDRVGTSALHGRAHRRLDDPLGRSFPRKALADFNVDLS